jgi:hypothetical protein
MALQLQVLLKKVDLIHCVIVFMKDESNNFGTMLTTL